MVSFKIENNCVIVTSQFSKYPLHTKNLIEIRNNTELVKYIADIMIRKWFTHEMRVKIERHVVRLMNCY